MDLMWLYRLYTQGSLNTEIVSFKHSDEERFFGRDQLFFIIKMLPCPEA